MSRSAQTYAGQIRNNFSSRIASVCAVILLSMMSPDASGGEVLVGNIDLKTFHGARSIATDGTERFVYFRDPVYFEETIVAGKKEGTTIRLLDGAILQVGENSAVVLDRYVYDPDGQTGDASIKFGTGVFRFVSGQLGSDNYTLTTDAATLSIRGTALRVRVQEDGTTIVYVEEGAVLMDPCGGEDQEGDVGISVVANGDCSGSSSAMGDLTESNASFAGDSTTDTGDGASASGAPSSDPGGGGSDPDPDPATGHNNKGLGNGGDSSAEGGSERDNPGRGRGNGPNKT